jgi:hypothetical protein
MWGGGPPFLGNTAQYLVFFGYLLGRDLNPKRETRICDRAVGCVIVDQRPVLVSRTQNTHDRHQLSSKISCHACL